MTMIERVARALAIAHGTDPDAGSAQVRHVVEIDGQSHILTDHMGPLWRMYKTDARAAIAAMKEPSADMNDKGSMATVRGGRPDFPGDRHASTYYAAINDTEAEACWRAMIDAALTEDAP